jgi:hypothetical protein
MQYIIAGAQLAWIDHAVKIKNRKKKIGQLIG